MTPLTRTTVPYSVSLLIIGPDYILPHAKAPGGSCTNPKQEKAQDGMPSPHSLAWGGCGILTRLNLLRNRLRSRRHGNARGSNPGCWNTGVLLDNWVTWEQSLK